MLLPLPAKAEGEDESVSELLTWILAEVDLSEWDAYFRREDGQSAGLLLPTELVSALVYEGGAGTETDAALRAVYALTKDTLPQAAALLAALCGLALLTGMTEQMLPSPDGIRSVAMLSLRAVTGCLALLAVWRQVAACRDALTSIATLSEVLLPVLLGLLTMFGQTFGATALRSGLALLSGAVTKGLYGLVFPLAVMGGVTGVIDTLSDRREEGVSGLFFGACRVIIGVCTTGYVLLTSVQGMVASAQDGLLLRTGKLAAGSLPVLGGLVGGSLDTVFSLLSVVRNAVGLTGIVLVALWLLRPALQLALFLLALHAAAFVCAPLGAGKLAQGVRALSRMLGILLSALVAAAAMLGVALGAAMTIGRGVG